MVLGGGDLEQSQAADAQAQSAQRLAPRGVVDPTPIQPLDGSKRDGPLGAERCAIHAQDALTAAASKLLRWLDGSHATIAGTCMAAHAAV